MSEKIIVTGGAGFIGSHIADAYVARGHRVVVIDNLVYGSRANINPEAKFYKADICNARAMEQIFAKEKPELTSHHAALISVVGDNLLKTLETNIMGTANVLMAFAKHGKGKHKKIIFPSSAAVYGDPKRIPTPETTDTAPLSLYGLSKLLAEEEIKFYARHYGFDYLIFRYANIYGSRQRAGVVPVFARLMRSGKRIEIFGNGKKTRDYLHVSDVVRANMLASRKGAKETINLSWGKQTEDRKLFAQIAEILRYRPGHVHAAMRPGEIVRSALNSQKAERILGWKPKMALGKGLRDTLQGL